MTSKVDNKVFSTVHRKRKKKSRKRIKMFYEWTMEKLFLISKPLQRLCTLESLRLVVLKLQLFTIDITECVFVTLSACVFSP